MPFRLLLFLLAYVVKNLPGSGMVRILLRSVPASSPTAVAIVVMPTGPPLNFSMIVSRILLSISSRPYSSTFNAFNACCVMARSTTPLLNTWAKSLTLLKNPLAILGVPRLLPEISLAASEVILT